MLKIYADGGLLGGENPNPYGGTYAAVAVYADTEMIAWEHSGVLSADMLGYQGAISNNVSELYALCLAILKTPEGEEAHFYCDSEITLGRVFCLHRCNNVPMWLLDMRKNAHAHLRKIYLNGYTLVAGHPNREHLVAGWHCDTIRKGKVIKGKNLPVSAWNVYADRLCNEARAKWEAEQEATGQ